MSRLFHRATAISLSLLLLAAVHPIFAQRIVDSSAGPCEANSAWLDLLMQRAAESETPKRIFVIARLGRGEMARNLNQRRLHNARTYLQNRLDGTMIVIAEGERVNGEGRVEFYLGSELFLVSLIGRGRDLCVSCFDGTDARYYGCGRGRNHR